MTANAKLPGNVCKGPALINVRECYVKMEPNAKMENVFHPLLMVNAFPIGTVASHSSVPVVSAS